MISIKAKRAIGGLLALAVAAPAAALAASSPASHQVHAYIDRSGTVTVRGYDGGAALAPAAPRQTP